MLEAGQARPVRDASPMGSGSRGRADCIDVLFISSLTPWKLKLAMSNE